MPSTTHLAARHPWAGRLSSRPPPCRCSRAAHCSAAPDTPARKSMPITRRAAGMLPSTSMRSCWGGGDAYRDAVRDRVGRIHDHGVVGIDAGEYFDGVSEIAPLNDA